MRTPLIAGLAPLVVAVAGRVAPAQPTAPPPAPPPAPHAPKAEPSIEKDLVLGARIGLNAATVKLEPDFQETDTRNGLAVAGFVRLMLNDRFSAEVGIGYGQRGSKQFDFTFGEVTLELDYFEIPAAINVHFGLGGPLDIRAFGGASVLILDAARRREFDTTTSIEGELSDYDIALLLGVGLDYRFADWRALLDIRYDIGLVNISDAFAQSTAHNRNLALLVGIAF